MLKMLILLELEFQTQILNHENVFSHAIQVLFYRPPMSKRLSFRTKQYPGVDCPQSRQ